MKEDSIQRKPIDVVVSGDLAKRVASLARRSNRHYRLWCLSQAAKDVLVGLFEIPKDCVGVISRYETSALPRKFKKIPDPLKKWSYVFDARGSAAAANKKFTAHVARFLRTEFGSACVATKFGEKKSPRNPVFISFSKDTREDFNTACAKAQSAGWPCILSDWGGHRDVQGPNVLKLPAESCGVLNEPDHIIEGRAYAAARDIHEWMTKESRANASSPVKAQRIMPKPVSANCLKTSLKMLRRSYGRNFVNNAHFKQRYEECFSAPISPQTKVTLVITPWERLKWESFNEIIPALAKSWAASASGYRHIVRVRARPALNDVRLLAEFKRVNLVAFTTFLPAQSRLIFLARKLFNVAPHFIIHLHGEATVGCLQLAGINSALNNRDLFLMSCQAEQRALSLCYKNARSQVLPYPIAEKPFTKKRLYSDQTILTYAGRISSQKNLHSLLLALQLLRQTNPSLFLKLEIYGSPDSLGSPNMGIDTPNYGRFLRNLTRSLGLEDIVAWKGFVSRSQLLKQWSQGNRIFVSPSVHSEENFGASALQALLAGNKAVLTKWGGHIDFKKVFAKQINYVEVQSGSAGPTISTVALARALHKTLLSKVTAKHVDAPHYSPWSAATKLRQLALQNQTALKRPLARTALSKNIIDQYQLLSRKRFSMRKNAAWGQIFTSYDDPLVQPLLKAYGMSDSAATRDTSPEK